MTGVRRGTVDKRRDCGLIDKLQRSSSLNYLQTARAATLLNQHRRQVSLMAGYWLLITQQHSLPVMQSVHQSSHYAMKPFFVLDTIKPFEEACSHLKAAVATHDFGLLAVHDLAATLHSKHIRFSENCRVFEVCNPQQAAKVLQVDMTLSTALPCRISIYTEAGKTRIGMIRPVEMLRDLSSSPELIGIAQEVESAMTALIVEVASPAAVSST